MKMSEILDIAENESSTENDKSTSSSGKTKTLGKTKIIGNLHTCHLPTHLVAWRTFTIHPSATVA